MRARDVMSTPVITVTPGTTVKQAATLMALNGFTALPVLDDDDRLVGMVTEADLVRDRFPHDPRYRYLYPEPGSVPAAPATVGAVMITPAVGMGVGADVADLVAGMWDDRVRSMPIVDGSRLVGIVTRRDLLRVLTRADTDIATDVRHRLANYGGPDRWTVAVHDGVVELGDEYADPTDRHVAVVLAEAVPGVTTVRATDTANR